jgi:hypothetical protein
VNYFDALTAAFAVLSLVAVYQLRPCTLALAGNNLLVSRALSQMYVNGKPASQFFLPGFLFSPENLAIAGTLLAISFVSLVVATVGLRRTQNRIAADAPALPRWLIIATAVCLVVYAGARSTIFTSGYASRSVLHYDFELGGGIYTFLCSILLYELTRRRLLGQMRAWSAYLLLFLLFFLTGYSKGGTGLTTGYLVTGAVLLLPRTGASRRLSNLLRISAVLAGILALSLVIRSVRTTLASQGGDAINEFIESLGQSQEDSSEGLETRANATQSASHVLMCTYLYDAGHSRSWRSLSDVVEFTLKPSVFVYYFGWSRPVDPATDLLTYFIHGGGINVLGECYWNGGYLGVLILVSLLSLFCGLVDKYYRSSPLWLMLMAQFAPVFLMGYSYGIPQVCRGAINGLLAYAVLHAYLLLRPSLPSTIRPQLGPLSAGREP